MMFSMNRVCIVFGMSIVFVGAQTFWILKWLREMDDEAERSEAKVAAGESHSDP